ncbi:MAG: SpoIIE family protein phosphatase [Bacteroidetes bacterium]|nr:SpoIIE family protein phosphatase [Bacteroidota bacterium]
MKINSLFFERKFIINAATLLVALLGLLSIYQLIFVNTTSNDECLWYAGKGKNGNWVIYIRDVKPGGVVDLAGIKNEDVLLKLNGQPVYDTYNAQQILNKLDYGQYAEYTIKRGDKVFTTKVFVKKLISYPDLYYAIFYFVWLMVGYLVIFSNPYGLVQTLFYLIGVFGTIYASRGAFIDHLLYLNPNFSVPVLYYYPWLIISCATAGIFVHFFLVFPHKSVLLKYKYSLYILYSFFIIPSLIAIYLTHMRLNDPEYRMSYINPEGIVNLLNVFSLLFGLISLIVSSIRYWKKKEGVPLRWLTAVYALGFFSVLGLFFFAPRNALIFYNNPEFYVVLLTLTLIPIAFAVAIFKYQLMDVSIVVKNSILYGSVSISIAVIYFLSIYGFGQGAGTIFGEEYKNFVAVLSFVIFALVFQRTKDKFHLFITKRFFPDQYFNNQILLSYGEELANIVGLENILRSVRDTFRDLILVRKMSVYLTSNDSFHLATEFGNSETRETLSTQLADFELKYKIYLDEGKKKRITGESFSIFNKEDRTWFREEHYVLIIPLKVSRRLIGFIAFGEKYNGNPFAEKDIESISSVASQIAVSVENARLYLEETKKAQLERDIDVAKSIQESLLPASFPVRDNIEMFGRMIPASHIGGDYFDIIKVSDSRFFLVIGDVSGKGLPAAIHMTRVQAMLRMLCTVDRTPAEILKELNKKIYDSLGKNWFITMTLIGLDTSLNCLRVCRAGHTPVLISHNGTTKFLQPKGLAVGLDRGELFDQHLEEVRIELHPNTSILLFSDGITEMMNNKNELFGDDRLKEIFSATNHLCPEEQYNRISSELISFRGEREPYDDETALIVRVKQPN